MQRKLEVSSHIYTPLWAAHAAQDMDGDLLPRNNTLLWLHRQHSDSKTLQLWKPTVATGALGALDTHGKCAED